MSEVGRRHQDTRLTNAREGFLRVCIHEEKEEEVVRVGRGYVRLMMKGLMDGGMDGRINGWMEG